MNSHFKTQVLDILIEKEAYKEKTYKKKETIVPKNRVLKKVYLIQEGFVKVSCFNEKGYEMIAILLTKNQTFGASVFFENSHSHFSYSSMNKCLLYEFELGYILGSKNDQSHQIIQSLIKEEYTEIEKRIKNLHHRSSKQRLLNSLLELKQKAKLASDYSRNTAINYPFNQNELADYTRTSRVTTHNFINTLKSNSSLNDMEQDTYVI